MAQSETCDIIKNLDDFSPRWKQSGCDGGFSRSSDFFLSFYTRFVFRSARSRNCSSGIAISRSLAGRYRTRSIELPGKLSDFAPRSCLLDVTPEYGISIV